jgi:subtilisin family serine protease
VTNNPAAALAAAGTHLKPGDVLLLEAQGFDADGRLVPAEYSPVVHEVVGALTAIGVVVVAAAGNGGLDLDRLSDYPESDSGAILVAAAELRADGWHRREETNRGGRIRCCGPGTDVLTIDSRFHRSQEGYDRSFSGTSAATAIVAGTAALISQALRERFQSDPTPDQVRAWLSASGNLHPRDTGIGVVPDLEWITDQIGRGLPLPASTAAPQVDRSSSEGVGPPP